MINAPILWGTALAFALGGAIAGNAVGSTQITDHSFAGTFYQTHENTGVDRQSARALPDHYPLVTRSGVVPVAALADRGLYSQARYRSFVVAASYADYADLDDDPGPVLEEADIAAEQPAPAMVQAATHVEPLDLAQGPAEVSGQGKIIDVQATLAMR